MTEEQKRTLLITGLGPTYHLYADLLKSFDVAVYDHAAAQKLSVDHGGVGVICPLGGAQPALFDRARNDAALFTAGIVMQMGNGFALNGKIGEQAARQLADPSGWLPGLAASYLADASANLRALDAYAGTDGVDIAGVLVHEDVTPRFRALALWGKARGVPVLHLPHNNCYLQTRPDIHDETLADWLLAASPWMRDWYAARGFSKQRIKVVGFPGWDQWQAGPAHPARLPQARARAILQLEPDVLTVCFCSGWPQLTNAIDDHKMLEVAAHVTLQAARREGWQLIWKMHPGDAPGQETRYAQLAAGYRVPAAVTRDHLPYALRAADVVLSTGPSNVLVEAGICDRPSALFPLRGYGFGGEPPWIVEPNVDSVVDTVARMLGDEWEQQRAAFVRRYAFKTDGKATARAARAVRRIINGI